METKLKCLNLIFFSMIFVSCIAKPQLPVSQDDSFQALLPKCEMNSSVRFLPTEENFEFDSTIWLDLGNYSQDTIVFPLDFNVKIYRYDTTNSRQWIQIENSLNYIGFPDQKVILEPLSMGPENSEPIAISPTLKGSLPLIIRVLVTSDSQDSCFGAFIDVEVEP